MLNDQLSQKNIKFNSTGLYVQRIPLIQLLGESKGINYSLFQTVILIVKYGPSKKAKN